MPDEKKKVEEQKETEDDDVKVPEDFDPKRAMKTIQTQRESEAKAIAQAKEAQAKLAEYESAEADKKRSLEEKLAARDDLIKQLRDEISGSAVEADFARVARSRGYTAEDIDLALIAAKSEDALGAYDPKTGVVGDHDFKALEAKFPQFASEEDGDEGGGFRGAGDAGRRGGREKASAGSSFNQLVRQSRRR